ncbi:hypothetical protein ACFVUY_24050 [Kitasatospora sp. NPDC058063]|uniref:hypothetical protein n=1 Tax=unclassified Kitasatospora TaxID=2633591 RepID=UPI0036DE1F72
MSPGPGRWPFGRRPGRGSGGPPDAGHRRRARAAPSGLRADLNLAPAPVIGRLETLERRGFVLRTLADLLRKVMLAQESER